MFCTLLQRRLDMDTFIGDCYIEMTMKNEELIIATSGSFSYIPSMTVLAQTISILLNSFITVSFLISYYITQCVTEQTQKL